LDKRVIFIPHRRHSGRFYSSDPPLHLQLQVRRTCLVPPEAEFESVLQVFQPKAIRAPLVCAIKKWTMRAKCIETHSRNHRRSVAPDVTDRVNGYWTRLNMSN
jgi:hypothetical protein